MPRRYVLMYDVDEDAYAIVRQLTFHGGIVRQFEAIDDIFYEDLVTGAQECQQLNNLMGEDAG